MEQQYRDQAIEIAHWLAEEVKEMPLFESPVAQKLTNRRFDLSKKRKSFDVEGTLDESILPTTSIELAHLDVHDSRRNDVQVVPFRLTTFDIDSEAYQRSVYLNVCGRYRHDIELLQGEDLRSLFTIRAKNEWKGTDSLYEAWMIMKEKPRPQFDFKGFEDKYPEWRKEKVDIIFDNMGQLMAPEMAPEGVLLS